MNGGKKKRADFEIFISSVVFDEVSRGDPDAADLRLIIIENLPFLAITEEIITLSKKLIKQNVLPGKAVDDALHISLAIIHEIDFLMTWTFRHNDNAKTKPVLRRLCLDEGLHYPEICTPGELMGLRYD